jgi:hypothetical protein
MDQSRSAGSAAPTDAVAERDGPAPASAHPYGPSHVDRLIDAVRRLPWPAPVTYLLVAGAFLAVEIVAKMLDGTFPVGFRLIHVILPIFAMSVLPAVHLFTHQAAKAIDSARPLLTLSETDTQRVRYELTTLPAGVTVLASLGGLLSLALLTVVQPADTFAVLGVMTSPATAAVEWTFQALTWSGVGVTAYAIVRQMRLVYAVTTRHTRISLFALGPIYAFSRLTATHAVFTTTVVALSSLALSRLAATPQWVVFGGGPLLLAAATFVVPLWGAHRLIAEEKERSEARIGATLERLAGDYQARVDRSELDGIDALKGAIEGTIIIRGQIRAVSTWPWQPATLSGVVSVLLAPLVIWLITRGLELAIF